MSSETGDERFRWEGGTKKELVSKIWKGVLQFMTWSAWLGWWLGQSWHTSSTSSVEICQHPLISVASRRPRSLMRWIHLLHTVQSAPSTGLYCTRWAYMKSCFSIFILVVYMGRFNVEYALDCPVVPKRARLHEGTEIGYGVVHAELSRPDIGRVRICHFVNLTVQPSR